MNEATKRFTIDISTGLHTRIKTECARRGVKMAEALRDYLDKEFISPSHKNADIKGGGTLKERAHQLSVYLEMPVYEALRDVAHVEHAKLHALVLEGIDLVLRKRGQKEFPPHRDDASKRQLTGTEATELGLAQYPFVQQELKAALARRVARIADRENLGCGDVIEYAVQVLEEALSRPRPKKDRLRKVATETTGPTAILTSCCESPIESILGSCLLMGLQAYEAKLCLPEHISDEPANRMLLIPQFPWRRHRVDFAVRVSHAPPIFLFIECDGHDFHHTPEQIKRDKERDQEMSRAGYRVVRFSGSELTHKPWECANRILKEVAWLQKGKQAAE